MRSDLQPREKLLWITPRVHFAAAKCEGLGIQRVSTWATGSGASAHPVAELLVDRFREFLAFKSSPGQSLAKRHPPEPKASFAYAMAGTNKAA